MARPRLPREIRKCHHCQKPHEVIVGRGERYCSVDCAQAARRTMQMNEFTCKTCNTKFTRYAPPSRGEYHYCSKKCVPRFGQIVDLTNMRFGSLVVKRRVYQHRTDLKSKRTMWECRCDCGKVRDADTANLRNGTIRDCGQPKCMEDQLRRHNERGVEVKRNAVRKRTRLNKALADVFKPR